MSPVLLSLGMGVDSTGILVRWLTDPASRDFPLSALTVVISQVGDEYPDTYEAIGTDVLPMLAHHRVRLVQLARPALTLSRGRPKYVVLDDSAGPARLVRSGPVRLSDELTVNGTIAQVSNRRCSLRWKGEPIDAWVAEHMPAGHRHVLVYAANETRRIDRDRAITRNGRRPDYPLQRWNWDRATTSRFLLDATGRRFERSCCAHCPFQAAVANRDRWAVRWQQHPNAAILALRLEYTAMALNPRMRLFGAHSARELGNLHGLGPLIARADERLATLPWALYDVRRTYTGPAAAMRSVRLLAQGSRNSMCAELARLGPVTVDEHGIRRVWRHRPRPGYPRVEHLLVAAPAGVLNKQRRSFEPQWTALTAPAGCGFTA
ncbi:hypothetical protein ACFY36_51100 [Actinoplanes sp. NPDC000266]